MDKGIFVALSGGIAKQHEMELIANNIANINTPGFKQDNGSFNEYLTQLRRPDSLDTLPRELLSETSPDARPSGDKSFVEMDGVYTNYQQGSVQRSGRPLDIALEGAGFLEVLTPAGVRYTRQGNLDVAPNGTLVTPNGYPVLAKGAGQGGGAPEQRILNVGNGSFTVTSDGIIQRNGNNLGAISIQEFYEPQWLEKTGNSYFKNVHPDNLKNDVATHVRQGFLEGSNVNAVKEMTRLIEATRAYESHMQAIKTHQEIDSRSVNEIARR